MTCAQWCRWFSPYLDDQLTPAQRQPLEQHLRECSRCASELVSLRQMVASLRAMEPPASPDLVLGIHRKLLRVPWWQRVTASWSLEIPWHSVGVMTAAVLVVAILTVPRYFRPTETEFDRMAHVSMPATEIVPSKTMARAPAVEGLELSRRRGGSAIDGNKLSVGGAMAKDKKETQVTFEERSNLKQTVGQHDADGAGMASIAETPRQVNGPQSQVEKETELPRGGYAGGALWAGGELGQAMRAGEKAMPYTARKSPASAADAERPSTPEAATVSIRWPTADAVSALAHVTRWVEERQGTITPVSERQLLIQLVPAELDALLADLDAQSSHRLIVEARGEGVGLMVRGLQPPLATASISGMADGHSPVDSIASPSLTRITIVLDLLPE